ncbi:ABC transporter permease subunit [Pseudooceanicola sp. 216_PA32_1]|jgi:peptide/nickel transport system permease protein|uniref:ABC transporter permease subunit n=1 Tax=Pseudooceanicola pacificus TaxID=2676438 RepID=A0A844WGI2_9RHOB|nr:ABC transporter permease [Pseudooceanicola pacificus]MWB79149.1 ABC transporter permease subunit [Pseudooceanicola pacificus]
MIRLILKRIALSVPLVIVVTMLTFVLNNMAPGDMAATLLQGEGSNAQYEELRVKLGLDRPVLEQYGDWLGSAAQGDLGKSFFTGESVVSLLNQRFWVSFSLVIGALILCVSVGISLGLVSALRGGFIARAVDVVSVAALIFPSFWVAIVLMSVFSVWLRWLPAVGYTPLTENPRLWFLGLILPVISVALHSITTIAKQTRDSMGDTMNRDFIRSLRACGIPERAIIFKHALRNASLPVVTVIGLVTVSAISGTVFVERVFVLPGLGSLAVEAALNSDIALLQGVTVYFTLLIIAVNLIVDLSYGWLNPKARVE